MFGNSREIRRINELKLRSEVERAQLLVGVRYFAPLAKKMVRVSIYAFAVKNLAPVMRPIASVLFQRGRGARRQTSLFKLVGLVCAGVGLARALSSRRRLS